MPRIKEMGTRTREYWSLSGTGKRSTCDDCGRRELRVGYQCKRSPSAGFCQRVRCWECAEIKRVERKTMSDAYGFGWPYYAVVGQALCKACRAEAFLADIKIGSFFW
jgi:hypothetical protein